jgi:hypothetical protein
MPAKRDVLAEIEDIRGRTTIAGDPDSGILKLLTIVMFTKKLKDDDQEDELHACGSLRQRLAPVSTQLA